MTKAFISHSPADTYFVDLLSELMRFHHIQSWYCRSEILQGTGYRDEIEKAMSWADCLIAIISKNAVNSTRVAGDVAAFSTRKPEAEIIALLLDRVNPNEVVKGVEKYQCLYFNESMLTGFRKLAAYFGREFLPEPGRRSDKDQRTADRRMREDRRKSAIDQRMRKGLWKCYSDFTRTDKFEVFDLSVSNRMKVTEILMDELGKYEYFGQDGERNDLSEDDLELLVCELWEELEARQSYKPRAVNVIEAIAEKIVKKYKVKISAERRGSKKDRRKSNRWDLDRRARTPV
jgi:hypothetical protein